MGRLLLTTRSELNAGMVSPVGHYSSRLLADSC